MHHLPFLTTRRNNSVIRVNYVPVQAWTRGQVYRSADPDTAVHIVRGFGTGSQGTAAQQTWFVSTAE